MSEPLSFIAEQLNHYFTFALPLGLGAEGFAAFDTEQIYNVETIVADGEVGKLLRFLSSSAWGVLTPAGAFPLEGDFNGDGIVNGLDFLALQANFGTDFGATLSQGDADHDSDVDGNDYLIWQANNGKSYGSGSGSVGVPEPAGVTIVLLMVISVLRSRWIPVSARVLVN